MIRYEFLFVFVLGLVLSSCSKLQYIDQALAVKAYSDEQDALGRDVARHDAQFEKLLAMVRSGQAQASVRTSAGLTRQFGEPVLKAPVQAGRDGGSRWLYRYQVKHQGPKIYVSVGPDGVVHGFGIEE